MQDEVNEKVVSLAIKTSKLTAEVLQKAMKALLAKGKGQLTKAPHGKITMRQLMKQGEKVSNIEITDQNIKAFDPIARKSGLDYNVKKIENGKPPTYLVSFKGKDIDVMTEAFREFTAKKLGRDKKPSIRKLLSNTFSGLLVMPHAPFLFMNWLTSCLPSPCRRLSRPRTTTEAPLPCRIFSVIFLGFLPLEIYRLAALRIAG